jgi:demethylmenaquinone methyltransferase/2-methoxy-6-polyprenyl-1,4-benzoquinol methylase
VLEVACGTGWWTRVIAPVAAQVTAFDAAPQTLALARARSLELASSVRQPAPQVEFIEGDAYAPPSSGARWEAAFAGFWWSHVPRVRLPAFLDALHERLAPGAPVVFLDNRLVPGSSTPVSPPDAAGDTWQERRLDDGSLHRVLKNFPDEAELRDAVGRVDPGASVTLWRHYWALVYRR